MEGADAVALMAFDLLAAGGQSLLDRPLELRKARLLELLCGIPAQAVLYVGDVPADAKLFAEIVVPLTAIRVEPIVRGTLKVRHCVTRCWGQPGWIAAPTVRGRSQLRCCPSRCWG